MYLLRVVLLLSFRFFLMFLFLNVNRTMAVVLGLCNLISRLFNCKRRGIIGTERLMDFTFIRLYYTWLTV